MGSNPIGGAKRTARAYRLWWFFLTLKAGSRQGQAIQFSPFTLCRLRKGVSRRLQSSAQRQSLCRLCKGLSRRLQSSAQRQSLCRLRKGLSRRLQSSAQRPVTVPAAQGVEKKRRPFARKNRKTHKTEDKTRYFLDARLSRRIFREPLIHSIQ